MGKVKRHNERVEDACSCDTHGLVYVDSENGNILFRFPLSIHPSSLLALKLQGFEMYALKKSNVICVKFVKGREQSGTWEKRVSKMLLWVVICDVTGYFPFSCDLTIKWRETNQTRKTFYLLLHSQLMQLTDDLWCNAHLYVIFEM